MQSLIRKLPKPVGKFVTKSITEERYTEVCGHLPGWSGQLTVGREVFRISFSVLVSIVLIIQG